jgi:hypothetical protein
MLAFRKFRPRSSRASRHGLVRRCVIAASLLAYIVVAAGVPLPLLRRPAKSGELFPCATSGCGCGSAEQCWRGCCCHTLAERLAWAKQNGVKPPAFALAEAKRAGLDASGRPISTKIVRVSLAATAASKTPACCQKKATSSCCKSSSTGSCCSSRKVDAAKSDESNFVIGFRALACHGQSLNWLAAVPTLITVELNFADEFPLVAWLGPHPSETASPCSETPTPPPPERA